MRPRPYWRPESAGRAQGRGREVDAALTMSVSPSFSHGAPSLTEVLITRTFAKPTNPFVDGEFLRALEHADDAKPAPAADAVKPAAPVSGTRIDVRA